jgi:aryl-alcohol dehydrogenase-like predicted oxidoreductase
MKGQEINKNTFGENGREVTIVGLGGEGILRTYGQLAGAKAVIGEAIRQKITYFDCARVYAGSEGYYGAVWSGSEEVRHAVFQASKSAMRDRRGALSDLATSLSTMVVSSLDLWQIHDVRDEDDLCSISSRGGALGAFEEAKSSGKVRFIGVTGHHDPDVLTRAVNDWPLDSVMLPVNPVEGLLGGFLDRTLPAAKKKGLAIIGMKVLGGGHYVAPHLGISSELLIRYALSWDIDVAIVGCETPAEVEELASAGRAFNPLTPGEMAEVERVFKPHADKLAYYRGTLS